MSGVNSAAKTAKRLAVALHGAGHSYAFGGAIALAYWSQPRGTVDVDLTLFVDASKPSEAIRILQATGCTLQSSLALASFQEHGFAQAMLDGVRVDVFLPVIDFYQTARERIQTVTLGEQPIQIWDAETLAVFKMMFFRRKDLADIEQVLRSQRSNFDADWVRSQLESIYGARDPRLAAWDELIADTST